MLFKSRFITILLHTVFVCLVMHKTGQYFPVCLWRDIRASIPPGIKLCSSYGNELQMCRHVHNSRNIQDILSYTICDLSTVNDAIYITKTSIPPTPLFHSLQDCKKQITFHQSFPPSITLDCSHNWFSQFVLKNEIFTYISFLRLVLFLHRLLFLLGWDARPEDPG
jgi:hypothetical protein